MHLHKSNRFTFFFFLSTNANSIGCAMRQMSANTLSRSKAAVYRQQWAGNAIVLRMHTTGQCLCIIWLAAGVFGAKKKSLGEIPHSV